MIGERLPATLMLTITALFLWVTIAILAGVYAAIRRYSWFDQGLTLFSYIFYSLPTFWLGLMLIFLFGPVLHLLPAGGVVEVRNWPAFGSPQFWEAAAERPVEAFLDIGRHMILPVTTLVLVNIAADSRFVRASMLEALNQDYVRTARAKGLRDRVVIGKHAFRNALLPVVTNVGLELPFLVTGCGRHRDDLHLARTGTPLHRIDRRAGLLHPDGADHAGLLLRPPCEPAGGRCLRCHRPTHSVRLTSR